MLDFLGFARDFVADLLRPRTKLVAENALLRQQLIVAEQKIVGGRAFGPGSDTRWLSRHDSRQHGAP